MRQNTLRRVTPWRRLRKWFIYSVGVPLLNALDVMVARSSLVEDRALLDASDFEWANDFENQWEVIRDELLNLIDQRVDIPNIQEISQDLSHLTTDDGWKSFIFFAYGYESEHNCALCPETARLLREVPGVTNALFSFLSPGKHIPRHRGEYKGIIRCHLGLIVPAKREKCRMEIGGRAISWQEGELLVFDNSRHHEVWNDSDETRVILLFDIIRPLRWPCSWINRAVLYVISKSPYVQSALKNQMAWDYSAKAKQDRLAHPCDDETPMGSESGSHSTAGKRPGADISQHAG